jgi:hypothetical protein
MLIDRLKSNKKPKLMERSAKSTLQLAVQQLFVRLNRDLVEKVIMDAGLKDCTSKLEFDSNNKAHQHLVELYKEKMGYRPLATNRDIFYSIMLTYQNVSSTRSV